jgi:transposase-like protein
MTDGIPGTLIEAVRYFADLTVCHDFMRSIKWPDGKVCCPKCGNESVKEIATRPGVLKCNAKACQKQFSVRSGTIFANSAVPLSGWFVAVWCEANLPVTSERLALAIGVTKKTAWRLQATIRAARELAPTDPVEYRILLDWPAYRIGNDGSVWSRWRKGPGADLSAPWRRMRWQVDADGYRRMELRNVDGEARSFKVCSLVCRAFHGPRPAGTECRHLDGDSLNDSADNLAWGTPTENAHDRRRHGTIAKGIRHGRAKRVQ